MKFTATIEFEVDQEAWNREYGPEHFANDVETYVLNQLLESYAGQNGLLEPVGYVFRPGAS